MSQEDLQESSGSVNIKSRLVSFLYDLMRDHLTAGQVEELVTEPTNTEVAYTNGYLAQYAWDLANRLQPNPFSQEGIVKDILRTNFEMVQRGKMTPLDATQKIYDAITEQNPTLTTGEGRAKNETVDPPRVKEFESGFSKQSILEAEDERVLVALKEGVQEGVEDTPLKLPSGMYGIFCEPTKVGSKPCWNNSPPQNYEQATIEADYLNRLNNGWHYYAKPIR